MWMACNTCMIMLFNVSLRPELSVACSNPPLDAPPSPGRFHQPGSHGDAGTPASMHQQADGVSTYAMHTETPSAAAPMDLQNSHAAVHSVLTGPPAAESLQQAPALSPPHSPQQAYSNGQAPGTVLPDSNGMSQPAPGSAGGSSLREAGPAVSAAGGPDIQEQAFEAAVAQTPAAEALLEAYEPAGSPGPVQGQHAGHRSTQLSSGQPLGAFPEHADGLLPSSAKAEITAAGVAHSLSTEQLPPGAVAHGAEGTAMQEQAFEAAAAQTPAEEALLEAYEHPPVATAPAPGAPSAAAPEILDSGHVPQSHAAPQDGAASAHAVDAQPGLVPSLPRPPSAVRVAEGQGPAVSSNGAMHPGGSTNLGASGASVGPSSPSNRLPGSPSHKGPMSPAVLAR